MGNPMLKREFIQKISGKTGLTIGDSEKVVNAVLDTIVEGVCEGRDVTFLGFGVFTHVRRVPRIGRNPRTGQEVPIPERIMPKFRVGSGFKKFIKKAIDTNGNAFGATVEKMRPPKDTKKKKTVEDKPKEKMPVAKKAGRPKKSKI